MAEEMTFESFLAAFAEAAKDLHRDGESDLTKAKPSASLAKLGFDPVAATEIGMALEDTYGVDFSGMSGFTNQITLAGIAKRILRLQASSRIETLRREMERIENPA